MVAFKKYQADAAKDLLIPIYPQRMLILLIHFVEFASKEFKIFDVLKARQLFLANAWSVLKGN